MTKLISLLERQDRLQNQAHRLIEKLEINQLMSRCGQPRLIGSAKHGLMTWRDVDFDVVAPNADY